MESISPVILRVREARAPAAGFSAPEPFGGFVRCASLRSLPPHAGRAENRAPHPPRRNRPRDNGEPLSILAAAFAHAPGTRRASSPHGRVSSPHRRHLARVLHAEVGFAAFERGKRKTPPGSKPAGFISRGLPFAQWYGIMRTRTRRSPRRFVEGGGHHGNEITCNCTSPTDHHRYYRGLKPA